VTDSASGTADSLHAAAYRCLMAATVEAKLTATREACAAWRAGELSLVAADASAVVRIELPGRPAMPRLVPPRDLPHRGLGSPQGRAALLHAVAHIEFNAIDLAWDAVYRFRDLPRAYYDDWVQVADDEARHFGLLSRRLSDYGCAYGDLDAHNGLWEMAIKTDSSCLARMALVPRVLEARGLDVTPGMIARLRSVGDSASADVLATILREEIAHVAAGSRWFGWCCERAGLDVAQTFDALVVAHAAGALKSPINHEARRAAGFSDDELKRLDRMAVA
jgi:uncharacterized ferritin-like protein (DUF455 family)